MHVMQARGVAWTDVIRLQGERGARVAWYVDPGVARTGMAMISRFTWYLSRTPGIW